MFDEFNEEIDSSNKEEVHESQSIINANIHRTFSGLNDDPNPIEYFLEEDSELGVFLVPPDPNWDGNMHTPVVDDLFKTIINHKVNAMRFSFVKYPINNTNDKYVKYIQQASVCFEEFLKIMPHVKYIMVIGYSFGSLIAMQLALRRVEIIAFIAIAPPLLTYDFLPCLVEKNMNGAVIYGTNDTLVPEQALLYYINFLTLNKMKITPLSIVDCGHYFTDKTHEVSQLTMDYIFEVYESYVEAEQNE
jgi:alpha/beta superfamily hydrolase